MDSNNNAAPNPPSQVQFQIGISPGTYDFSSGEPGVKGTISDELAGDVFQYDSSDASVSNATSATFNHTYEANVNSNGIATIDIKSNYDCQASNSDWNEFWYGNTPYSYSYVSLDATWTPLRLAIDAGTSAKVIKVDPNWTTDGNPAGPGVVDEYGNLQYQPGPEPAGPAGQYLGDIGIPTSTIESAAVSEDINLYAEANGGWSSNCSVNWQDTLESQSQSQTLTATDNAIDPFQLEYTGGWFYPNDQMSLGAAGSQYMPGDTGSTDQVTLSCMDHNSGVTENAELDLKIHQQDEAYKLAGPTSASDPNCFSYIPTDVGWGSGSQPSDVTQNFIIANTSAYADWVDLGYTGAAAQAISPFLSATPEIAALLAAAGVTADAIAAGVTSTFGSVSLTTLWPTVGSEDYPYQWPNQWGAGTPVQYPTDASAPSDWTAAKTDPSEMLERCTCEPWMINFYEMSLYGNDTWGTDGYEGYVESLVGKFKLSKTIGVWTWTPRKG